VKHFIVLSSSYSTGQRIALHYVIDSKMDEEMLLSEVNTIKKMCGKSVPISTHFIETNSYDWETVVDKDAFFEGVHCVETLTEFVGLINDDRELRGIDVAKYILTVTKCTHLQLEKLVYMCYAEYLCATSKRLFADKIYAFKYGPIVGSVYEEYKGQKKITGGRIKDKKLRMSARSRILFAKSGIEKLSVIDETLKKYGDFSASTLVSMTHVAGGPWDRTDRNIQFAEISDDVIKAYHYKEVNYISKL